MAYKRIAQVAQIWFWLCVLTTVVFTGCTATSPKTEADKVAIYSAVIRRIYTQDDTAGGNYRAPIVYVVRMTNDGAGDPDIERLDPKPIPESIQNDISSALDDLPTKLVWVDAFDDVTLDPSTGEAAEGGVIVTLGNIHFQDDRSALVSGSIYLASMAAGGQTYVVEQVDGVWTVTGNTGVEWIS